MDKLDKAKLELIHKTCLTECFGEVGNSAGCCQIGSRDYIIGPMPDAREFVKRLNAKLKTKFTYDELFIEFKEGSKLFPNRTAWQKPEHYPALRVDMRDERLACRFLTDKDECGVHDVRPQTCRKYYCEHLRSVLDNA